jgi:hypothetical protein
VVCDVGLRQSDQYAGVSPAGGEGRDVCAADPGDMTEACER